MGIEQCEMIKWHIANSVLYCTVTTYMLSFPPIAKFHFHDILFILFNRLSKLVKT